MAKAAGTKEPKDVLVPAPPEQGAEMQKMPMGQGACPMKDAAKK